LHLPPLSLPLLVALLLPPLPLLPLLLPPLQPIRLIFLLLQYQRLQLRHFQIHLLSRVHHIFVHPLDRFELGGGSRRKLSDEI
jgi:hypothetical protein